MGRVGRFWEPGPRRRCDKAGADAREKPAAPKARTRHGTLRDGKIGHAATSNSLAPPNCQKRSISSVDARASV